MPLTIYTSLSTSNAWSLRPLEPQIPDPNLAYHSCANLTGFVRPSARGVIVPTIVVIMDLNANYLSFRFNPVILFSIQ